MPRSGSAAVLVAVAASVVAATIGIWALFGNVAMLVLGVALAPFTAVRFYRLRARNVRLREAFAFALEQASVEHEQQRCIIEALEQSVMLTALNDEVLLLNGAGQRLLGYSAAELGELFQRDAWEATSEGGTYIPSDEQPIRWTVRTGEPLRDQIVVWRTKDGREVTVRVATQPVRDVDGSLTRVVTAFSDVTAERAIARELERTQARFEALVEQSTDLICLVDPGGSLVYASPAAERLLGFSDIGFLGRPFMEFLHPEDVTEVVDAYDRLLKVPGAVEFVQTRVATADGGWRHMEIAATNRLDDPAVGGVVCNARDVTERAEAAARLTWQAFHDPLTSLPNRALLLDRLGHALNRSRRTPRTTALMFVDLDDFKVVNDTLGHEAGDLLLVEVGHRLTSLVRAGDTVARLGGDEFIVLAEALETTAEALAIATRINEVLGQPIEIAGQQLTVSASIGVAFDSNHEPDHLLREADNALYRAKALGKCRFEVFADGPVAPPPSAPSPEPDESEAEALRVS